MKRCFPILLAVSFTMVAWSASSGPFSHYELQGSHSSAYTSPFVLYSGTSTSATINVSGTTWVRARACHGPSCSAWKNGDITATYTPGCI